MSLDLHVARAKSVGGIQRVYKFGSVPPSPPSPYVVLSLDSGAPSTYTLDSRSNSAVWLTAQCFASTIDGARDMARRCDLAFRDVALVELPDSPFCNRLRGGQPSRDPDGETLIQILHVYQYLEDR